MQARVILIVSHDAKTSDEQIKWKRRRGNKSNNKETLSQRGFHV